MTAGSPRLCLGLALLLSCVSPLGAGMGDSLDAPKTARQKLNALSYLKDVPRSAVGPQKKPPQFMLDLFNAVSVTDGTSKSQTDILEGNTVRSLNDKGQVGDSFHYFNLSSVGKEERMIKAQFRWFRKKMKFYLGKFHVPHLYKVDLYEVPDNRLKPCQGNLITSRLVPRYTQGWEIFNVTQMVSKWIQNSQNNGIQVVTALPSSGWMESALHFSKQDVDPIDTSTYLVIFSHDGRTGASNQSYLDQLEPEPAAPEHSDHHDRKPRAFSSIEPLSRQCRRVSLLVDFEQIGWSDWIISPRGYNAYRCIGSCPFPLGVDVKATNHATVRSIMHALKVANDDMEPPCCVPDTLQSMSLLYFDDEENVVLKQYDDMMVSSCGCH